MAKFYVVQKPMQYITSHNLKATLFNE